MGKILKNDFERIAYDEQCNRNIYKNDFGESTLWDLIRHTCKPAEYYNSWILPSNYGVVAIKTLEDNSEILLMYFFKFSSNRRYYHIIKNKDEMPKSLLAHNIGHYNNRIRTKKELKDFIKLCKTSLEQESYIRKFK